MDKEGYAMRKRMPLRSRSRIDSHTTAAMVSTLGTHTGTTYIIHHFCGNYTIQTIKFLSGTICSFGGSHSSPNVSGPSVWAESDPTPSVLIL